MGCRKRFCRTFVPGFIRQRGWLQVLLLQITLIVAGAAVLVHLEAPHERSEAREYAALLRRLGALVDEGHLNVLEVATLRKFCERTATAPQFDTMTDGDGDGDDAYQANWSPVGATWFMFTLVSTIGYGSFTPQTDAGRIAVVGLGVVGIPMFGYLMVLAGQKLNDSVIEGEMMAPLRECRRPTCRRRRAGGDGGGADDRNAALGETFLAAMQREQRGEEGGGCGWGRGRGHLLNVAILLSTLAVGTLLTHFMNAMRCPPAVDNDWDLQSGWNIVGIDIVGDFFDALYFW